MHVYVRAVRTWHQEPSPDKEMQPASKARTWQPVLLLNPAPEPSDGASESTNPPAAFMPLPLEQSMGAPRRVHRESSHLLGVLLHHDLVPNWSGKTGIKDPRWWFGFF